MYSDYVSRLAKRFHKALDNMEVEHAFEYGAEFEVALCKVLRDALPEKFGVARGYAENSRGERAGDDIFIFEQIRFPTFRRLGDRCGALKERIPIEAIYCYIEAKHTLHIDGNDRQSLKKAVKQIQAVKRLCRERKPVALTDSGFGFNLGKGFKVTPPAGHPNYRNPLFTAIFARRVKLGKGSKRLSTAEELQEAIKNREHFIDAQHEDLPDIMVLGDSTIVLPIHSTEDQAMICTFLIPGSGYRIFNVNKFAFGVGFCALMAALDRIQLGDMPWSSIIGEAVGAVPKSKQKN